MGGSHVPACGCQLPTEFDAERDFHPQSGVVPAAERSRTCSRHWRARAPAFRVFGAYIVGIEHIAIETDDYVDAASPPKSGSAIASGGDVSPSRNFGGVARYRWFESGFLQR